MQSQIRTKARMNNVFDQTERAKSPAAMTFKGTSGIEWLNGDKTGLKITGAGRLADRQSQVVARATRVSEPKVLDVSKRTSPATSKLQGRYRSAGLMGKSQKRLRSPDHESYPKVKEPRSGRVEGWRAGIMQLLHDRTLTSQFRLRTTVRTASFFGVVPRRRNGIS